MRRTGGILALLLLAGMLGVACRQYMPANRYLQPRRSPQAVSLADARARFNHAQHARTLEAANLSCIDCHRYDVQIDSGDEAVAREVSGRAMHPGPEPCHACHRQGPLHMTQAPDACITCHSNLAPLMPDDHQIAWQTVHKTAAVTDPAQCESCHRQSYCIDCHERRDTVQRKFHSWNYQFIHSVDARANPMQCGSCHRQDYCINCHKAGKVDPDKLH